MGLQDLKTAFENIIDIFPKYTIFSNDNDSYYDIINYLQKAYFKVSDERLNSITLEKRKEMVKDIRQKVNIDEINKMRKVVEHK